MAAQTDRGVPLSTLSPKFLHTNSTSHTWPFSAIAELIDNAYDPDVSAKQFWIDKTVVKGEICLSFMDNGNGLEHETMHKMLSFGYSDKIAVNGLEPIGIYGNGFKSGSMRLGKDAIVFSKSKNSSCIGMLSQNYLEMIGAKQIVVPIISVENRKGNKFSVKDEHKASLRDILQYSLFKTQEELLTEIDIITSSYCSAKTGTRIIIWNLRRTSTGSPEFDFTTDRYDIRIPSEVYEELNDPTQPLNRATSYVPESVFSLRAYCSILYLKPRMQVMIRGQKVKSQLIAKSLAYIRKDHYKPNFLEKRIPIIFGYNTKSKAQYGIMMYHKNRLIKAYERVGCQLKANIKGVGVIGVIECNFLDPTHNKQSFIETDKYRKTINSLGVKLEEYWHEIRYRRTKEDPNSTVPVEDTMKRPDQNWVQCDGCLRWRKLPDGIDVNRLPEKWYCLLNPDPQFRSCKVEEEPEDSDDDLPSYRKTYKQQERENKRKQEQRLQQDQLNVRNEEEQYLDLDTLDKEAKAFKRQHNKLTRQLHQTSPAYPMSKLLQGGAVKAESSSSVSQAACSPSSSSTLPVITSVCSLSAASLRGKRGPVVPPQNTPKRPRMNGIQLSTSEAGTPRPVSVNVDSSETDDTDDDLVILETESTPKPQKPVGALRKVKQEREEAENEISVLLECSDDAAVEETSEATPDSSVAGAGPPPGVASTTTQTTSTEVKQETESQNRTEGTDGAACRKGSDPDPPKERAVKQEINGGCDSPAGQPLTNGVVHMEGDEGAGPSSSLQQYPNIDEVQEQQDKLLELMQDTAQERDGLKEQVKKLTSQLQELQKQPQVSVKKESSHQGCQTDSQRDYKALFESAKQKINDLIKDKEALLAAAESQADLSCGQDEENDIEEISHKVGRLVGELEQKSKERDELRSQLDNLEEEKLNLAAQCEELKLRLQQQREEAQPPAGPSTSGMNSDAHRSLIELRQNVGRLLISQVPALDLAQVNYECNVIDEILEQVVSGGDFK